ncbi:MAG: acetaldehyde dehydrogenase [Thermoleophilaceae bacterium]|nr:acetaldehyde dehydrogenase [Thermoleophilaceae bacterium]
MRPDARVKAAILGPGNIGTDLMVKLQRVPVIELALMVGIYPDSAGLARAAELGVATSTDGLDAVLERDDIELVFEATAAQVHVQNAPRLEAAGKRVVDLTPAAVGPYVVPSVNIDSHLDAANVNLVSCGGQATIPFVHAIDRVADVDYAEIVATIASKSAGQGTRQNIDEFTTTTARGIEVVGGAGRGKAIIILNPAEPPIHMRDTVFATVQRPDPDAIEDSVQRMAEELRTYVPGCRLLMCETDGRQVTVMVEIAGAADFLPAYAGNLDIMTAAAARVGGRLAEHLLEARVAS